MDKTLNLIWIDLEMTGLLPEQDFIIEIATLVTDPELNVLAEGPVLAIKQPDDVLAAMDDWNQKYHGQSGLIERVKDSGVNEAEAQRQTLEFLRNWVDESSSPMCGNSICQDRRFLARYMPELERFFHYRNLDVSSVKEIARRWKPGILNGLNKQSKHIALDDIKDSIEELAYYRQHFFQLD
jgi:oligoribonuclease